MLPSSFDPRPMEAFGPIIQKGPISTSSSITARGSIETFSAMRVAIAATPCSIQGLSTPFQGTGTFEHRPHHFRIQAMSVAVSDKTPGQIAAGQGEVADHIEDFVPDALVGKPQRV